MFKQSYNTPKSKEELGIHGRLRFFMHVFHHNKKQWGPKCLNSRSSKNKVLFSVFQHTKNQWGPKCLNPWLSIHQEAIGVECLNPRSSKIILLFPVLQHTKKHWGPEYLNSQSAKNVLIFLVLQHTKKQCGPKFLNPRWVPVLFAAPPPYIGTLLGPVGGWFSASRRVGGVYVGMRKVEVDAFSQDFDVFCQERPAATAGTFVQDRLAKTLSGTRRARRCGGQSRIVEVEKIVERIVEVEVESGDHGKTSPDNWTYESQGCQ
ncbi:hypothetical protein B0H13DRAFT_1850894 [Mycena leptocephala]|nr:hypothetical protein B0H13DRAFT_1850894 [Mycena leptocephala]